MYAKLNGFFFSRVYCCLYVSLLENPMTESELGGSWKPVKNN